MKKTICFDFDGVIHKYSKGWRKGVIYDEPIDGVKDFIDSLKKDYYIVVCSARVYDKVFEPEIVIENISRWLNKYNIYYDEVTGKKPIAIAYIDDRAIEFNNNWDYVKNKINVMRG